MKRRRRRKVFIIGLLLLVGGAIVNVAVAWGCAMLVDASQHYRIGGAADLSGSDAFHVMLYAGFGTEVVPMVCTFNDGSRISYSRPERSRRAAFVRWGETRNIVDDWIQLPIPKWSKTQVIDFVRHFKVTDHANAIYLSDYLTLQARGWPLRSLWCGWRFDQNAAIWKLDPASGGLIVGAPSPIHPLYLDDRNTLPIQIWWPGFAINTIVYAAMLWVVFFAPGTVKRTLRRRRGLCPACAYPIGTSPVCTECGSPLPRVDVGRKNHSHLREGEGSGVRVRNSLSARTGMGLPSPATPAPGRQTERTT